MLFKELSYIQRADRKVLIVIILLLLAVIAGLVLTGNGGETTTAGGTATARQAPEGQATQRGGTGRDNGQVYYDTGGTQAMLFAFDPNTADSTALLQLGLKPWMVRNIYKYRAKGGIFRRPSDFARVYGLTAGQYKALEPYIRISPDYLPASSLPISNDVPMPAQRDSVRYPIKLKAGQHIALNTADTTLLKKVPGIGSGYARAIVGYRERLGGFSDVSQVLDIDGLPHSALAYLTLGGGPTRKLNINKLTLNQLRRHPYINFYQAKAIIDYRRLTGPIRHLNDLSLSKAFSPADIERLQPYVEY